MRHALFVSPRLVSGEAAGERSKRKSIFKVIVEALHHSRREQAERTLHQYRHLIHKGEGNILGEPNKRYGGRDRAE